MLRLQREDHSMKTVASLILRGMALLALCALPSHAAGIEFALALTFAGR